MSQRVRFSVFLCFCLAVGTVHCLSPVLIVPGNIGSALEAKLTDAQLPDACTTNTDWEILYLAPLKAFFFECFAGQLVQSYDANTQTYSNTPGVEIRAYDFGGVNGVTYTQFNLDYSPIAGSEYFQFMVEAFEEEGYQIGQDIASAPFDFRRTSNPGGSWDADTKSLIEALYANNDNEPVFLVAHSLGNIVTTHFLDTMTQEWKDQHVSGLISIAGPWYGSTLSLKALLFGDNALIAQTWGSSVWLLPNESILGSEPLVVTDTTSYNFSQLGELLEDIGANMAKEIFDDLDNDLASLPNPEVPLYCVQSDGIETELWYEMLDGLDEQPTTIHYDENGDGVLSSASLQKCLDMNPIDSRTFSGVGHSDLVRDSTVIDQIISWIKSANSPSPSPSPAPSTIISSPSSSRTREVDGDTFSVTSETSSSFSSTTSFSSEDSSVTSTSNSPRSNSNNSNSDSTAIASSTRSFVLVCVASSRHFYYNFLCLHLCAGRACLNNSHNKINEPPHILL